MKNRILMLTKGGIQELINSDMILYVRVNRTHSIIKLSDGRSQAIALSLKQFEKYLPPDLFCRTHRSYIVALDHVKSVHQGSITLTGKEEVPLSEDFRKVFYSHFVVISEKAEKMEKPEMLS